MHRLTALLVVTGLAASGCQSGDECASLTSAAAETVTAPELEHTPQAEADIVLVVTNAGAESSRLTVRIDGGMALDVRLPAGDDYCGHEPVFSYGLALADGAHEIQIDADGHRTRNSEVTVDDRRRWITVAVQDGFPVHVDASRARPAFG